MSLSRFSTMDPHLVMSLANTKLRDEFSSLTDLIRYFEIDESEFVAFLKKAGYEYQAEQNQFR